MAIIQLGTPQEKELSALVLAKLTDFGWPDNDTLANFIVVMVANDKTKEEITSELNDILPGQASEFSEWLFNRLSAASTSSEVHQAQVLPQQPSPQIQQAGDLEEPMDTSSSRKFTSEAGPRGRLLMNAISTISSATRSDPAPSRQAPSRVYGERRQEVRDRSISPIRSREVAKGRDSDDRIRFRRTSDERSRDEARIAARLGPLNDINTGRKGRQGRDNRDSRSRDKSWDDRNDYHDRRNRGNPAKTREQALRDIERRLGPRADSLERSSGRSSYGSNRRESSYEQEENDDVKPARCKFWPNCAQGDKCQFWHPKELCPLLPNCPSTADACYYVHPLAEPTAEQRAAAARQALLNSMRPADGTGNALQNSGALGSSTECKFGARCTRPDCMFRHSERESKQPCRFFPNCTKPNCPFYHPPYGESLANGAMDTNDNVTRLPIPCKFGDMCTRSGCHFTHPRDSETTSNVPLCKFNPCTRKGCTYRHVPGGAFGGNKTLVLNNSRPHTSDRFAGATANEDEVEKLHVPASTHWANGGVSHQPDADVDMDVAM